MPANLFLVDRTVQSKDVLLASLNANTTYVEFEPLVDTYASLKEKVAAKIAENGAPFTHVALAQHSTMNTQYSILLTSAPLNLEDVAPYASWDELKAFLGELKALGITTFDFLACSIYRHINMQAIFAYLEAASGVNLRASTNFTGNFEQGGDWILESDNADIRNLYFNESVEQYAELFIIQVGGGISSKYTKFVLPSSGSEYVPFLQRIGGTGPTAGQYYTAIENSLYQEIPTGKVVVSTVSHIGSSTVGYTVLFSDNTMMTVRIVSSVKTVSYDSIPAGRTVTGLCSNIYGAYCALLDNGSIYIWGTMTTPTGFPDNIKFVKSLHTEGSASLEFELLTNTGRRYTINSNGTHSYSSDAGYILDKIVLIDNVIYNIYTNGVTNYTFPVTVTIPSGVGVKNIIKIGQSQKIYIAHLTDNTVVTWKNFTSTTTTNPLDTSLLTGKKVTAIYADAETALLVLNDNTLVTCGKKTLGGLTPPTIPQGETIKKVYAQSNIYILLSNGQVLRNSSSTWTVYATGIKDIYDGQMVDTNNSIYIADSVATTTNTTPMTIPANKYLKYTGGVSSYYFRNYIFNSNIHAPVTGITPITSPKSTIRFLNEQVQLSCSVIPANAEDSLIRWYSSNDNVLTVSQSGLVTSVNNGNAFIYAVSRDGDFTAYYEMAVNNVPVTGISPIVATDPNQLNLHTLALVNATLQLKADVNPLNSSNTNVTWTSSDPAIATVSSTGLVKALARGTTYITATSVEGNYTTYPYSITVDVQTTTGVTNNVTVNTTAVTSTDANTIRNAISSTTLSAATSIAQIKTELTQGGVGDTQIAKSPAVISGTSTFQATVADVTAINTMYNSGTATKLASTTNAAIDTFIPSTPNVATVGVVLTETKLSSTSSTVAAVTLAVAKLDANNNRITSTLTDPTTYDTVVVTLPKTAYLKITHLGGTYEATNQVYTDLNNTTIGAVDLTTAYIGKLYTFTSAVVPYVQNIKILVLDVTTTTVKVAYTGPFSETIFEPAATPPPDVIISTEVANSSSIACFPAGTRLLTPSGYKAVESLKTGDKVMTADGRAVTGKVYSTTIAATTTATAPYRIAANTFPKQTSELRVSPLHAIQKAKGVWEIPEMAAKRYSTIEQYGVGESVTYYHVEAPNFYTDNLVAEGVTVESYAGKQVSLPNGTPLYKFNAKINGFTRYTPSKSVKKN